MRVLVAVLTAVVALALAWHNLRPQDAARLQSLWMTGGANSSPAQEHSERRMNKCLQGDRVVYSQAPCPAGSRAGRIEGGSLTTIPGQRPAVAMPARPASLPNARALAGDPLEPSIMERRIEQAVGE